MRYTFNINSANINTVCSTSDNTDGYLIHNDRDMGFGYAYRVEPKAWLSEEDNFSVDNSVYNNVYNTLKESLKEKPLNKQVKDMNHRISECMTLLMELLTKVNKIENKLNGHD